MARAIPQVFGSEFHAQMPLMTFDGNTWSEPLWQASDRLVLHPAAHCLHYGSTIFEGMKAFRHADGRIAVFRLDRHVTRLMHSAQALHLPVPDAGKTRAAILELVRRAADDVPDRPGALYLRPTLIGTEANVGKAGSPSAEAMLYVLASPVGDYFVVGSPMKLLVETEHARCAPHMGSVKTGGNYASALHWQTKAKADIGANQVIFCPRGDVQETGASNFILIKGNELITKALSSEFLHGVTRDSVLQVARDMGLAVSERDFRVEEMRGWLEEGAEAILTGTAAVISPVTSMVFNGEEVPVAAQEKALQLRQAIMDIQYGVAEDRHGWLTFAN
ncbi:MAG: branched-chain-amino-acid transaminase [Cardiobacteriaceae bacterium]|nr:branched-chain-amino-acid transaminase [Cardiobacteriaceae bacterium]